jgi:hypothetical protein
MRTGPAIAEQVAARGDPEFAGLHMLGVQPTKAAVETLVLMLFFDTLGLGSDLDALIATVGGDSRPSVAGEDRGTH